jgi:hypothetical protein
VTCQNVSLLFIYFFGVKYVTQWPLSFYRTAIKMYDHFTQSENTHEENKLHINYYQWVEKKSVPASHPYMLHIIYASAPDMPPPAVPYRMGPAEKRDINTINTPTVGPGKSNGFREPASS